MAEAKKPTKKKSPAKKAAAKKAPVKKKNPPAKKTAAHKKSPPVKKSWGKMNIAERTAFRKRNGSRILAVLASLVLLGAAAFLLFCVEGYSFSAMVCLGIVGIIGFYQIVPGLCRRSRWVMRMFTFFLTVFLILACATEAMIIKASFGSPETPCRYLLVLGARVRPDGPSLSLQNRIDAAYDYLTAHPDCIAVLSGGKGDDEHISEAQCMFEHLTAMGIDAGRLWMEDRSTSTQENLRFSMALIEEKTGQRPAQLAVLSSEYHLFRAGLFTGAAGADFIGIPAETSNPFLKINGFLREVAGVWYHYLLGGYNHA